MREQETWRMTEEVQMREQEIYIFCWLTLDSGGHASGAWTFNINYMQLLLQ